MTHPADRERENPHRRVVKTVRTLLDNEVPPVATGLKDRDAYPTQIVEAQRTGDLAARPAPRPRAGMAKATRSSGSPIIGRRVLEQYQLR